MLRAKKSKAITTPVADAAAAQLFCSSDGAVQKKKRSRLSIPEKKKMVGMMKQGVSIADLAKAFEVGVRTVQRVKSEGKRILNSTSTTTHISSSSRTGMPVFEEAVLEFIDRVRARGMSVTRASIQQGATRARARLLRAYKSACCIALGDVIKPMTDTEKGKLEAMRAEVTFSWVKRFVARNGLESVLLHGTAGAVDVNDPKLKALLALVTEKCNEYDADCIFNVDEYGLFYRLLPRQSYLGRNETRKNSRGSKGMKAKDRVTGIACTNAT